MVKAAKTGFSNELMVLYYAVRHHSAPLLPKIVAAFSFLYLLSPVDLVPDFIPFAGWLDDLVIVPLLLHLSFRLLPARVVEECRLLARGKTRRFRRVGWIVLAVLLTAMGGIYWYLHSSG